MSSALSKFAGFFHRQFGSPSSELDQAVEGITEHVERAIAARIEPLEKRIAELTGGTPVAADGADPFAEIREEMAALRQENADLRAAFEKHASATAAAVQKRLAEVEPGKSGTSSPRTPVPPRSAATAS